MMKGDLKAVFYGIFEKNMRLVWRMYCREIILF